nr:hypothetical protein BaRGS_028708 [Batillaria attramentaria]
MCFANSYSKVLEQKEELEQKHLHLLQILDSERQAKWHYVQQTEELAAEVKKLKEELQQFKKEVASNSKVEEETDELKKIKKVKYTFMLITCIGSVYHFLSIETLLFLHQIFLKGLSARLENWPTLVLGDLFDMLLPMLSIYQEYVRNHHYSLQVLAEYKQKHEFNALLKRYEEKPACEGRSLETFLTYPMHQASALKQKFDHSLVHRHTPHSDPDKPDCQGRTLETFLTYPMHQIPRYIITLHELLAHTPHDHVERESLEYAKSKLEELSRVMHDEVSETENIRKNLAIERMIIEGCDILLDVNQTFVRQAKSPD